MTLKEKNLEGDRDRLDSGGICGDDTGFSGMRGGNLGSAYNRDHPKSYEGSKKKTEFRDVNSLENGFGARLRRVGRVAGV